MAKGTSAAMIGGQPPSYSHDGDCRNRTRRKMIAAMGSHEARAGGWGAIAAQRMAEKPGIGRSRSAGQRCGTR